VSDVSEESMNHGTREGEEVASEATEENLAAARCHMIRGIRGKKLDASV
jgi:hypothetical protein